MLSWPVYVLDVRLYQLLKSRNISNISFLSMQIRYKGIKRKSQIKINVILKDLTLTSFYPRLTRFLALLLEAGGVADSSLVSAGCNVVM